MVRGKSIHIFLTDGSPSGIKIAKVSQWTGTAIQCPRQQLQNVKQRPEVNLTGVYILSGPDQDSPGDTMIYIGEGDTVWSRIEAHNRDKDFWEQFVSFTSTDESLTKAHVRYLEARMIQDAVDNKRAKIDNGTTPEPPYLPEADIEDMEFYLDYVKLLLPTLGINIFEPTVIDIETSDEVTCFVLRARGAEATGYEVESGFAVKAGSTAAKENVPSLSKGSQQLKEKLIETGILIEDTQELYKFAEDYIFSSTSIAADVISGQSMSGPQNWKTNEDVTYKDYKQALIDETPDASENNVRNLSLF